MTETTAWALAATCIGLCIFLFAERRALRALVWVGKPLASLGFLAVALSVGALQTPVGQALFVALVLSFWGDILLIPADPRAFLGGLGSFLLGHLGFAAAFVLRGVAWGPAAASLVVLVPAGVAVGRWLLPHVDRPMKVPVLAYMTVITAMVATSVGTSLFEGGGVDWAWTGAAVCFFVSDLSVARDRFVSPGFANRAWGLPLYYGAQVWFALLAAPESAGG